MRNPAVAAGVIVLSAVLAGPALGTNPPDSEINPQSGFIETVDEVWTGSSYGVRHTIQRGQGPPPLISNVATGPQDELRPRIAIEPDGDTWVVWWRSGIEGSVLARRRVWSSGSWDSEVPISASGDDARNPDVVIFASQPWLAFEKADPAGRKIVVGVVVDGPDPFPILSEARTTSFSGDLDVMIHSESGHLWVTWVDSESNVGWSEYRSGAWSPPAFESYASDDVTAARGRIRNRVIGN